PDVDARSEHGRGQPCARAIPAGRRAARGRRASVDAGSTCGSPEPGPVATRRRQVCRLTRRSLAVLRDDRRRNPAARGKGARDAHAPGAAGGDQVVEDAVDGRLVEDALVAVALQVELQRLELDAGSGRGVGDEDLAEVGLSGLGTHRGELRTADLDLVVAFGTGVREGLDRRGHAFNITGDGRMEIACVPDGVLLTLLGTGDYD